MQSDTIQKIIESVNATNFNTQYLLNYFEFFKNIDKDNQKQLKPSKNFEKIIQNIHNLHDVNKLKFFWSLPNIFENGHDLISQNLFSS